MFNFYHGAMANLNGRAMHFGGKAEPGIRIMQSRFLAAVAEGEILILSVA